MPWCWIFQEIIKARDPVFDYVRLNQSLGSIAGLTSILLDKMRYKLIAMAFVVSLSFRRLTINFQSGSIELMDGYLKIPGNNSIVFFYY